MAKHAISADPAPETELDEATRAADDRSDDSAGGPLDTLATRAGQAMDNVADLARGVPETVDRAAATTGRVLGEAQRAVESGSDTTLLAGASLTAGLALGLLVGRAPRLVVAVALLPAAVLGIALVDRRSLRLGNEPDATLLH